MVCICDSMSQFINFSDEPVVQCDVSVAKNTFEDDGDIQIVTKMFDRNI